LVKEKKSLFKLISNDIFKNNNLFNDAMRCDALI